MNVCFRRASFAVACILLMALLSPGSSEAGCKDTLVFDDGGEHTIDFGTSCGLVVSNATTLNAVDGAQVTPNRDSSEDGIRCSSGSTINVLGGILAGSNYSGNGASGGHGIEALDCTLTIAGGIIRGGSHDPGSGSPKLGDAPGVGLRLQGNTQATITGGTIEGGSIGASRNRAMTVADSSVVDVRGGAFKGGWRLSSGSTANVFGANLLFDGTTLTGTLQKGESINVEVDVAGGELNLITVVPTKRTSWGVLKASY